MSKPPKHSKSAEKAHPAPKREDFDTGGEYAEACRMVSEAREAFDRPKLTTEQRLDAIGLDAICARIADGEDDGTIAASLGMSRTPFRNWLASRDVDNKVSSARADSAEAWLDKGLSTIASALPKDGRIDASAARAYAQECARRAAIRNPAYRDKQDVNHGGQPGNPVEFTKIERVIVGK